MLFIAIGRCAVIGSTATENSNKKKKKNKQNESFETSFEMTIVIESEKKPIEKCSEGAASQDDLDAELEACNSAIEADPGNGNVYYYRGFNFFHLERFSEAENDFTKAISLETNFLARSYYQRGVCMENQQRLREAAEDFNKAHDLRPEWSPARRKVEEYYWAYR